MMKYAEEIIKEIENRETINTDDYLIDEDDAWENYIRGKGSMSREKRNHVSIIKMMVKNILGVIVCNHKTESEEV